MTEGRGAARFLPNRGDGPAVLPEDDLFAMAGAYPAAPAARGTDTSRAAALAMLPRQAHLQRECLRVLGEGDYSADQVAEKLGETVLAVRPRICELKMLGLIVDSGERAVNASGHKAIVWRGA